MIHIGIILMLLGYSGSTFFSHGETLNLSQDTKVRFEEYDLVIVDFNTTSEQAFVTVEVQKDGVVQGVARPGMRAIDGQLRSEVSIVRLVDKDLYFVIDDISKVVDTGAGARAQVKVKVLPAINALWAGSVLLVTGTALRFVWTAPLVPTIAPSPKARPAEEE